MKTIAAALLLALSGKPVTEEAMKAIFKSVNAKEDDAKIKIIVAALKDKKPEAVIAEGLKKLSAVAPAGGEHHEEHEDKKTDKGKDKGGKDKGKGGKDNKPAEKPAKAPEPEEDDIDLGGLF